ncbi:MAG: hypothetical protein ACE5GK_06825 [Nitrospiria bacterium]
MSGGQIEGKGLPAFVGEIADGFKALNPLILKKIESGMHKSLFQEIAKIQRAIRSEPFPTHDIHKIRQRNIRLQRLNTAATILQHYAKEKKILLF